MRPSLTVCWSPPAPWQLPIRARRHRKSSPPWCDSKISSNLKLHLEWSINEKVAFEVALANSFAGRRSAVIMKQVGLNVAADPLMSAAYTGVKGGFVVVVADDPGPHSSQTEQDSRFMAMAAKLPVLDPSSPVEARDFVQPGDGALGKIRNPGAPETHHQGLSYTAGYGTAALFRNRPGTRF